MPTYNTQPASTDLGFEEDLLARHHETQLETTTTENNSEVFKTPEQRDNEFYQIVRVSGHRVAVTRQQLHAADSHEFALAS